MTDPERVAAVADRAANTARGYFGEELDVHETTVIAERGRSLVLRCAVRPRPDLPRSFIAKLQTGDAERGFSDWAGLAFLSEIEDARGVAPRFYGGDIAARLVVMEDLGRSRTLADVLAAGEEPRIRQSLRALAVTMARLVAATAEPALEARYEKLRAELPDGEQVGRKHEAMRWRAGWPRAAAWWAALDCSVEEAVEESVEWVANVYADPDPFLAFSHGDPAPTNNHVGPARVRLLDFEYGGYRHALYDLTGWYVLCPLPEAWVAEMQRAFRGQLAGRWTDEADYHEAWAAMCAYRALAMLSWLPLDILDTDRPWVEDWTMRGALVMAATRLGRATAGVARLAAVGAAGDRLARAARARWPELGAGLPQWPGSPDRSRSEYADGEPDGT
jgi:hypothetical protein